MKHPLVICGYQFSAALDPPDTALRHLFRNLLRIHPQRLVPRHLRHPTQHIGALLASGPIHSVQSTHMVRHNRIRYSQR